MTRLYQKLAAIEREEIQKENGSSDDGGDGVLSSESQAIVAERTGRVRILTKSVSVDSGDQEPQYAPTAAMDTPLGGVPERRSIYGRYAEEYEDAPVSQTLPASIRIGELTITPGIEALTKSMTPDLKRAAWSNASGSRRSSQHKLDRTKFFENYPPDTKDLQQTEKLKQETAQNQKPEVEGHPGQEQEAETHAELEPQKTASKPFLFYLRQRETKNVFVS